MTAFQATFSDFRTVKSRKVVQLVLEIPIEAANQALTTLGGVPNPESEVWVAVARLDPEKAQQPSKPAPAPDKPRRKWGDLKPSEQAGIACQDTEFWQFLRGPHGQEAIENRDDAARVLRHRLGVKSRAELDYSGEPVARWSRLHADFLRWSGRTPEIR